MDYNDEADVHRGGRAALLEALDPAYPREYIASLPTEELQEMLAAIREDQASAVELEKRYPKVRFTIDLCLDASPLSAPRGFPMIP